ncbi:hypothetical protein GDO81_017508 [Engystomops pustulosus]|uniref:Uncharacterized protein n=1 Tax=Engystomops pustulosus TaxID=76066 RepID=A0AAV7AIZ9_ENGPU|nr:hypothetical protein GDO81_017508 [Engystomops pustulosus]
MTARRRQNKQHKHNSKYGTSKKPAERRKAEETCSKQCNLECFRDFHPLADPEGCSCPPFLWDLVTCS